MNRTEILAEIAEIKAWQKWARQHPHSFTPGKDDAAADRLEQLEAELALEVS
jgi:flagellar motility protein MotE (MotC chaperone)